MLVVKLISSEKDLILINNSTAKAPNVWELFVTPKASDRRKSRSIAIITSVEQTLVIISFLIA